MTKIVNHTGQELTAGMYWGVGFRDPLYADSKEHYPLVAQFTGEAPCLTLGYFGSNCTVNVLIVVEPLVMPQSVAAMVDALRGDYAHTEAR